MSFATHIRLLLLVAVGALSFAACGETPGVSPKLSELQPNAVEQNSRSELTIVGERFFVETVSDVETGITGVDHTFSVTLYAGDGTAFELDEVLYLNETTLRAIVPVTVPAGVYSARVAGPLGVGEIIAGALTVYTDYDMDSIADDVDSCVDVDGDGLGRGDYDTSGCEHIDADSDDADPTVCADTDQDECDDCSSGTYDIANDGTDEDGDGFCIAVDCHDSPAECGSACNPLAEEICDGFDNDCDGAGDPMSCDPTPSIPPIARFVVSPSAGTTATIFAFDGGGTTDVEDATATLQYSWDFDGDGTFDASGISVSHSYASLGTYTVTLQVRDSSNAIGYTSGTVRVDDSADVIIVDTAVDNSDSGDGVTSLREAIAIANGKADEHEISFSGPMTILLTSELPSIDGESPTHIAGGSGVEIDGAGFNCLDLQSAGSSAEWLALRNCDTALRLAGSNTSAANLDLSLSSVGILASGATTIIGPRVEAHGNITAGIEITGAGTELFQSRIFDNLDAGAVKTRGVRVGGAADNCLIWGNTVFRNEEHGVELLDGSDGVAIWNNTIDSNGNDGLRLEAVTNVDVRNNLVSNNSNHGLHESAATTYSVYDSNNFFSNDCGGMTCTDGSNATFVDPLYVDAVSDDLRIQLSSPLIDTGIAVPVDLNLDAAGTFNGLGPDRGAFETP
jgi:PKD repeat protein